MERNTLTASLIIHFCEQMEDVSAAFYADLAEKFPQHAGVLLAFAKESQKNRKWIVRTYQETISDALEACFCFEGMSLNDYAFEPALAEGASWADALATAFQLEEKAVAFYTDAAERSESLLATIPGVFRRAAKNRTKRGLKLRSIQSDGMVIT